MSSNASISRIVIMGAGNTIMGDEGIGPRCIEALHEWYVFPEHIDLLDVGTMGLQIIDVMREYDHMIVIDAAIDTGHPAGTVVLYTPEELAANQVLHTAHDMRLTDVIKHAKLLDVVPQSIVIVAVQVESISEWVLELSAPVQEALPIACACALDQLKRLGYRPTQRAGATIPYELVDALENFAPQD